VKKLLTFNFNILCLNLLETYLKLILFCTNYLSPQTFYHTNVIKVRSLYPVSVLFCYKFSSQFICFRATRKSHFLSSDLEYTDSRNLNDKKVSYVIFPHVHWPQLPTHLQSVVMIRFLTVYINFI
jgi:hypothetical protein